MSKLEIIALSGVVYKVNVKHCSQHRALWNSIGECDFICVFNFYGLVTILQIRRKPNLSLARYSIPIRKSLC